MAVAGFAGAVQLASGTFTPPVSDLEPLGLDSWVLPGVWLGATVGVPSAVAAILAVRRSPHTPTAVMVASGLLLTELVVQIPFIGFSALQPTFGAAGAALGVLGFQAHRSRTWTR